MTQYPQENQEVEDILNPSLHLEETYYNSGFSLGQTDGATLGRTEGRRFGLETGFEKFASIGRLHGLSLVLNSRIPLSRGNSAIVVDDEESVSRKRRTGRTELVNASSDYGNEEGELFLTGLWDANRQRERGGDLDGLGSRQDEDREFRPPPLGSGSGGGGGNGLGEQVHLKPLSVSGTMGRVEKHVSSLYALTELETLSIENAEEAVSDFDDRYRRAVAKAGIISRMIGQLLIDGTDSVKSAGSGKMPAGEGELEDIVYVGRTSKDDNSKTAERLDNELEVEIR